MEQTQDDNQFNDEAGARKKRVPIYKYEEEVNFDDFDEDYYEMIKPTYELDTDDRVFYDKVGKYFQIRMIFKLAGFKFIK